MSRNWRQCMTLHKDLQYSTQHIGSILCLQKKLEIGRNVIKNKEERDICNIDFSPISAENGKEKTKKRNGKHSAAS